MKQRKSVRAAQQAFNFNRFFFVLSVAANIGQTGVQLWFGHRPLDVHVFGQTLDISTSLVRLPTPSPLSHSPLSGPEI